jgi:predicted site-specific integrase-resolvase
LEPKKYTTTEAGRILGVTNVSIWRYIKQGQLQAQKEQHGLSWQFMIEEKELRRFSNQHQTRFNLDAAQSQ